MSSIRQQVMDAMLSALNTGRPGTVPQIGKWTGLAVEDSHLPFSSLARAKEVISPVGTRSAPIVRRTLRVEIEHLVAGTATPSATAEENAEPLLSWNVKALVGNSLGGLAIELNEGEITWTLEQADRPYVRVTHRFEVVYTTHANDADLRT